MGKPSRVVALSGPNITDADREAVLRVLAGSQLSLGPTVPEFESELARTAGTRHAIAVNSGTSALHLCVKAMGVGDGDEVITTSFSFVASANCILFERGKPVFVDIDPVTLNIDVGAIEAAITSRTKAILPVHVFGLPCDMAAIRRLAERHGLAVIEDACEAIGAKVGGTPVGGLGDCGVFAFYPNKQMTTAEGGAVVTDNDDVARLCRSWRNQGRADGDQWLSHVRLGYNYRLSDVHAALGVAQITRLTSLLSRRAEVANIYARLLAGVPGVSLPVTPDGLTRSWFVYVVLLDEALAGSARDQLIASLRSRGVGCSNYFPPIHLQPFYAETFGHRVGDLPVTEAISQRTLALPFHSGLSSDDLEYVVDILSDALAVSLVSRA